MNTYGERFRVTTYGESHGLAVGAIIDGCPAGISIDMDAIASALARRRNEAPRQEVDEVQLLLVRLVKGHSRCSFKPLTQPFWRFTKIINRQSTPEGQSHIRQAACNVAFYFSFIAMCNSSN